MSKAMRGKSASNRLAPEKEPAPHVKTLKDLIAAEHACRRCPLYRDATQVVPGEGPGHATMMMVGEQPGDQEDIAGHPFVGPAGRMLDRAIVEAGIDRGRVFVTNAVKPFKFEPRGKRRLHKRPNAYEIERCRWWLDLERAIVKPSLIVALGATAARSLYGRTVTINKLRGTLQTLEDGARVLVTMHPSSLLRSRDDADRRAKYRDFVADLELAARILESR